MLQLLYYLVTKCNTSGFLDVKIKKAKYKPLGITGIN